MFPLNSNDQYIDSNGKRSKLGDAIGSGGGGGSTVTITPVLTEGTKIAEYEIDGEGGNLYAPAGGGGGSDKTHVISIPLTSVSASWNEKTFDIPGTYDLTNCVFSVAFGKLGSQARFTSPFIFAMAGRRITIDFFNQDGAGSISGNLTLIIQEP